VEVLGVEEVLVAVVALVDEEEEAFEVALVAVAADRLPQALDEVLHQEGLLEARHRKGTVLLASTVRDNGKQAKLLVRSTTCHCKRPMAGGSIRRRVSIA